MDVLASMDVLVLLIKTRASSPDATSLLFHSLPLLTRFQGYHPRENSGIKDACRRVLEHLIHKHQVRHINQKTPVLGGLEKVNPTELSTNHTYYSKHSN